MSRRTTRAAEAAAAEASNAARILAQRSHETKSESTTEATEPTEPHVETTPPDRIEKLLNARPHSQAMEEIATKRGLNTEEPETVVEAPTEPKADSEVKTEPEPKVEAVAVVEAPKTVRVKIDGEEFDAPADDVEAYGGQKAYQIAKANENRLAKTNVALEETRKLQAQMAAALQKQTTPEKVEPTDIQFIAERMQKVRFGTDEEAAQAQLEISHRLNKPVDQQAITSQVTSQIAHDAATRQFDSEFADLAKNPVLLSAVLAQRNIKLAQLQGKTPVDWSTFYRNIGNEVRSAFGRQSQPATETAKTTSTTSQPSDKEARKASIVNLPTAAARAELPKEEKELTPEEERKAWIADAKKARGQG